MFFTLDFWWFLFFVLGGFLVFIGGLKISAVESYRAPAVRQAAGLKLNPNTDTAHSIQQPAS